MSIFVSNSIITRKSDAAVGLATISLSVDTMLKVDQPTTVDHPYSNTIMINRIADYDGGSAGWVNSAVYAKSVVSAKSASFEWAITGTVDNSGSGENVGVYGQCLGRAAGVKSWGMVAEARDYGGSPATNWGIEIDCFANSNYSGNNLMGAVIIAGKAMPDGQSPLIYTAAQIEVVNNDNANASYQNGLQVGDYNQRNGAPLACVNGINMYITGNNVLWDRSVTVNGIAMTGTYTGGAYVMNAGASIVYDNDLGATARSRYNPITGAIELSKGIMLTGATGGNALIKGGIGAAYGIDFRGLSFTGGYVMASDVFNLQNDGVMDFKKLAVQPTAGSASGFIYIKVGGVSKKIQVFNV